MKITLCTMRIISTLKPAKIACININCHGHSAKKGRPTKFLCRLFWGVSTPVPPPLNTGLVYPVEVAKYYHRTFSCLVVQSFQFTCLLRDGLCQQQTALLIAEVKTANVQDTENANRKPAMTYPAVSSFCHLCIVFVYRDRRIAS